MPVENETTTVPLADIHAARGVISAVAKRTPIVSSVAAQMLEANPALTPAQIKRILIDSAERLPDYEIDRQGWGVIDPRSAVKLALSFQKQN